MKISIWGTRGSIPSPSPDNQRYGGNTPSLLIEDGDNVIILDAGSGIRGMTGAIPPDVKTINLLLTHLHLDHIMGLGFFGALYNPSMTINIWGPRAKQNLADRLTRYLSPPLFPVRLRDLPCDLNLKEVDQSKFRIGDIMVRCAYVCHPGPTVGYRLTKNNKVLTYIPDHEPALGSANFPSVPEWTSGYDLAIDSDILFHDAQYTKEEYASRIGWGHSSVNDAVAFATMVRAKRMLMFHHDPSHTDEMLEKMLEQEGQTSNGSPVVEIAAEGSQLTL